MSSPQFSGSIPEMYQRYMVPLVFEFYARDLARRVAELRPQNVLELAAGTGVVTRELDLQLAPEATLVATDLSPPMIEFAWKFGGLSREVEFRAADALNLPFADGSFDVVLCQFGAMFFSDKARAYAEARRVLRAGGRFVFNVWGRLEANEFALAMQHALSQVFESDTPDFMARIPHGYYDAEVIAADLSRGGFGGEPTFETLETQSRAESAQFAAVALCQATPLRNEIETRAPGRLAEVTERVAQEIAKRCGSGPVTGKIQAHVLSIAR